MATIDVRQTAQMAVTDLQFADNYSLEYDSTKTNLVIKDINAGTSTVICPIANASDLITAIKMSNKIW